MTWAEEYNKNMKPMSKQILENCRKRASKFIFINDRDGNGHCSRCNAKVHLGHTKHLSNIKCPNCKKEMQIQHTWRAKKQLEVNKFYAVGEMINNHTAVLRFIHASSIGLVDVKAREVGRAYIDEYRVEMEYWTTNNGTDWIKGKGTYFKADTNFFPNKYCAPYLANLYSKKQFMKEMNKLDCFKYFPLENIYDETRMITQMHYVIRTAKIRELLGKINLELPYDYSIDHYIQYGDRIAPINNRKTTPYDIMKITKRAFNLLRKYPRDFTYLQKICKNESKVNEYEYLRQFFDTYDFRTLFKIQKKIGKSIEKITRYGYIQANKNLYEWNHYLTNLEALGYDLTDTHYSMPKDFKKADEKITMEYNAKREEIREAENKEINEKIAKIKAGLYKMPELKEFLNGSNGLFVYVPENISEFESEGKALHNCIGTYPERVADGETMVFYVRKLSAPNEPFVAFEWCDGHITQCRKDYNKEVDDKNVINFTKDMGEALSKVGFLTKTA